jgi:hypothetical protein
MGYAALTHPTQEFGVIKSMILTPEVGMKGFATLVGFLTAEVTLPNSIIV